MNWTHYADSLDLLGVISKADYHHMIILIAIEQMIRLCHRKSLTDIAIAYVNVYVGYKIYDIAKH